MVVGWITGPLGGAQYDAGAADVKARIEAATALVESFILIVF